MTKIVAIISGIGFLIMLYLFLSRANETVKVLNSLGSNANTSIKTLQGR